MFGDPSSPAESFAGVGALRAERVYRAGRRVPLPGVFPALGAAAGVAPAGRGNAARTHAPGARHG
ncbi:hypothetical protein SCATT_04960 [Streptantibioticus cattleyicolor NRRL 8057 = DSM 46488]|uniref:Uncharacterized protein n=1 Tax=Streptantibioticus cattleyicolor (strain ATCC 35852 / DSM 46488 / JCM 4925 / NBRC 14057 / NRRL 8057) TaxID=1003195 RepID=G8WPS8_STREN|nr:hypothetical protein SCATT_04960 [Streptantibioticus cattleyicolor NRRL 8057 = DSM 46488]